MTPRAPATACIIRSPYDLPHRQHSIPSATRPTEPLTSAWVACSKGAVLMYAKTTVVRNPEKSIRDSDCVPVGQGSETKEEGDWVTRSLRYRHNWVHRQGAKGSATSEPTSHPTSERSEVVARTSPPISLHQQWPQALAVGPATALMDCSPEGLYFETDVELAAQVRQHFRSRLHAAVGSGQRPLLHVGVTSVAPPEGPEELLDEPYTSGEQCWLVSTGGHVYSEGIHRCTLPITWPPSEAKAIDIRPVRPCRSTKVGLLVTDAGALHLFVDGSMAASSPPDIVPRALAWGIGSLFPMIVLGPNIWRATLRGTCRHDM